MTDLSKPWVDQAFSVSEKTATVIEIGADGGFYIEIIIKSIGEFFSVKVFDYDGDSGVVQGYYKEEDLLPLMEKLAVCFDGDGDPATRIEKIFGEEK